MPAEVEEGLWVEGEGPGGCAVGGVLGLVFGFGWGEGGVLLFPT